jgi:protein-disulfide isomerase
MAGSGGYAILQTLPVDTNHRSPDAGESGSRGLQSLTSNATPAPAAMLLFSACMRRSLLARTAGPMMLVVSALGLLPAISSSQEVQQISVAGEQSILAKPRIEITHSRHPDVNVVEYFDYNCPFCKKMTPALMQLLAGDKKIALIYKDWPILGDASVYAARCALAAQWQGRYLQAHDALLSGPRFSQDDQVEAILRDAGINVEKLKKDLVSHSQDIAAMLARNDAEASALELKGTPGILVGRLLLPGVTDSNFLKKMVAEVRARP